MQKYDRVALRVFSALYLIASPPHRVASWVGWRQRWRRDGGRETANSLKVNSASFTHPSIERTAWSEVECAVGRLLFARSQSTILQHLIFILSVPTK